jgi:hypothetical protein
MTPIEDTSEKLKTLPSDRLVAVSGLIEAFGKVCYETIA